MAARRCSPEFVAFAHRLADASAGPIRRHFRTPFVVDAKSDNSPVTIADREAETAIRRLIEATFPDHGIIGEEFAPTRPHARHVWVLDPIDGTRAFVAGKPLFGTLIALLEEDEPILGVIDQPVLGERWIGAHGSVTTLNGAPVRTRSAKGLDRALLSTTSPEMFVGADAEAFERLRRQVGQNHWGGDAYAYGLLASGFIDVIVEAQLKLHDFAALAPVIEGAGGLIRDWRGDPLTRDSNGYVLAVGDPSLLAAAAAALTG
ncbi:MAG: histidinol-phosphatase [Alphaproteobacteria bacterium]|nr:histidinol-phosphatase [Alphaproteobacteria bacterium]